MDYRGITAVISPLHLSNTQLKYTGKFSSMVGLLCDRRLRSIHLVIFTRMTLCYAAISYGPVSLCCIMSEVGVLSIRL